MNIYLQYNVNINKHKFVNKNQSISIITITVFIMVMNFIVSKVFVETPDCCTPLSNTRVKENNSSLDKPWSNFNLAPADKSGCLFRFGFVHQCTKKWLTLHETR